jgi:uncharacterized protein (UPF0218 family)
VKLKLTDELREELKKPFGKLTGNPDVYREIRGRTKCLITVGDRSSFAALMSGVSPNLMIYDHAIQRKKISKEIENAMEEAACEKLKVVNEPGTISGAAMEAIKDVLERGTKGVCMDIRGEEDLLVLPCVRYAEIGSIVTYGQPGEGTVVINVTNSKKKEVERILKVMKNEDRGN